MSGRQLSHGTTLYRSYIFKNWSNLRFSFPSFGVFLSFLAQSSWRPIVKTLNLKVWTLPLIFLHDSTLFVIDMHKKRSISLVSTQFYHFHFHPLAGLNCYPHLISCLMHHNRRLLPHVEVLFDAMGKTSRCSNKLLFIILNFYSRKNHNVGQIPNFS